MTFATSHIIFTIGHSTHPKDHFTRLLLANGITVLCDVRSKPYSRTNPQFNREELKETVRRHGIKYVFLGKELGARSDDPACYENGKVKYDRLARTELFTHGLERIQKGVLKYRIALMCAEKEPLECHRSILIARHLVKRGLEVRHILRDGRVENQDAALTRLTSILRLSQEDMFRSEEDRFAQAYLRQEKKIAYDITRDVASNVSGSKAPE